MLTSSFPSGSNNFIIKVISGERDGRAVPGIRSDTKSLLLDGVLLERGRPAGVPALPSCHAEWGGDPGQGPERDKALPPRAQVCSSVSERQAEGRLPLSATSSFWQTSWLQGLRLDYRNEILKNHKRRKTLWSPSYMLPTRFSF